MGLPLLSGIERIGDNSLIGVARNLLVKALQIGLVIAHRHFHQKDFFVIWFHPDAFDLPKGDQLAVSDEQHLARLVLEEIQHGLHLLHLRHLCLSRNKTPMRALHDHKEHWYNHR